MPKISSYKQGTPSWVDLATTDEAGALAFYSSLFGWTDDPAPMDGGAVYHMQKLGDEHVGAIFTQGPEEAGQGIPPHWNTYLSVEDVDATADRVASAGGTVLVPALDVMEAGRMTVIQDPTGGASPCGRPTRTPAPV